jgi:hypothetical protein
MTFTGRRYDFRVVFGTFNGIPIPFDSVAAASVRYPAVVHSLPIQRTL